MESDLTTTYLSTCVSADLSRLSETETLTSFNCTSGDVPFWTGREPSPARHVEAGPGGRPFPGVRDPSSTLLSSIRSDSLRCVPSRSHRRRYILRIAERSACGQSGCLNWHCHGWPASRRRAGRHGATVDLGRLTEVRDPRLRHGRRRPGSRAARIVGPTL